METVDKRTRKIDPASLSPEQLDNVSAEMGKLITAVGKEASAKINKLTKIYGMEAKIIVQMYDLETGEIIRPIEGANV